MEITKDAAALLATVAVGLGGRSQAFRVTDENVRALAKEMQQQRKRPASTPARVKDADDAAYGALRDATRALFDALDDVRDAFKSRHVGGAQVFRDAMARYAVLSRVPVPTSALSTRYGSEVLNYARKHWHNYATTNADDSRFASAGFGIDSPNHGRVTDEPEDAVQVAVLHILENGESVTVGNIYRAVKYAATRLSRGYRAWDYAPETPLPAYDHARDKTVAADYASVEEWRNAIRAYAAHREYADMITGIRARIADMREARAALMDSANAALFTLLQQGYTVARIAEILGLSPETVIRNAANAGKRDYSRVTFLPAIPEDRDDVSTDIEETMIRRARNHRILVGMGVL